ncbi:unnamed protein product, partial [Mesorhabditis spiculigera]
MDPSGCREMRPLSIGYLEFLYTCRWTASGQTVKISYIPFTSPDDVFAVSIRVLEWTSPFPTYLLPASPSDDNELQLIMMNRDEILSIVPLMPHPITDSAFPSVNLYVQLLDAMDDFSIAFYAGSDTDNDENLLVQFGNGDFSLELLIYNEARQRFIRPSLLTSPLYPWKFDNSELIDFCFEDSAEYFRLEQVTVQIFRLEGGTIEIRGDNDELIGNYSRLDLGKNIQLLLRDLKIRYCPNPTSTSRRGFLVTLSTAPYGPSNVPCTLTFPSNRNASMVMVPEQYTINMDDYDLICVTIPKESPMPLTIETRFCDSTQKHQFELGYMTHNVTECGSSFNLSIGDDPLYCCILTSTLSPEEVLGFRTIGNGLPRPSLFFQILEYGPANTTIVTLNFNHTSGIEKFTVPENADNETLVFFSHRTDTAYANMGCPQLIVYGNRRNAPCDYGLYAGALGRHLATFSDHEAVFPQLVTSETYSIKIPPSCSPTIALRLATDSPNGVHLPGYGIATVTAPGYGDPMHSRYYGIMEIKCSWNNAHGEKFFLKLEVVEVLTGRLMISISDGTATGSTELSFDTSYTKNGTWWSFESPACINISWTNSLLIPLGVPTGFLAHFEFARRRDVSVQELPSPPSLELEMRVTICIIY